MRTEFNEIFTTPENAVFKIVFYPDRVYHAAYLNATRSSRYRYYVHEVRNQLGITVLKGEVYLDGEYLCNFLRIEYRAIRLVEQAREKERFLREELLAWVRIIPADGQTPTEATVRLHYDRWINAYQVEIWETLEPPANKHHDFSVLDMMGNQGDITRIPAFNPALQDYKKINHVELAFRENDRDLPMGYQINQPQWDNNYLRTHQEPRSTEPSSPLNTVEDGSYLIDFQRAWFLQANDVPPVRYRNGMMEPDNPEARDDNIIEMRWLIQQQLAGGLVFFHQVTIPPGCIEGTHQHIGTEELYYIIEGEGNIYAGANDDPNTATYPTVVRPIYGLEPRPCRELPVKPGNLIFTKSGGIHGIRNTGDVPLRFVAFLYHTT
jgi:mannose-6-phosphate isomerase-like protein (cupin superfamily)